MTIGDAPAQPHSSPLSREEWTRTEALIAAVTCREDGETDAQTMTRAERFARFIASGEIASEAKNVRAIGAKGGA